MKLTIELIPKTSFFTNLRSMLKPSQWDFVRRLVYTESGYLCEICGGKGSKHPVECHEEWEYNESTGVQKLKRLIALCPNCHAVNHAGFWINVKNEKPRIVKHLAKINHVTAMEAEKQISDALEVWEKRSQRDWKIDMSLIEYYLPD